MNNVYVAHCSIHYKNFEDLEKTIHRLVRKKYIRESDSECFFKHRKEGDNSILINTILQGIVIPADGIYDWGVHIDPEGEVLRSECWHRIRVKSSDVGLLYEYINGTLTISCVGQTNIMKFFDVNYDKVQAHISDWCEEYCICHSPYVGVIDSCVCKNRDEDDPINPDIDEVAVINYKHIKPAPITGIAMLCRLY